MEILYSVGEGVGSKAVFHLAPASRSKDHPEGQTGASYTGDWSSCAITQAENTRDKSEVLPLKNTAKYDEAPAKARH